MSVPSLELGGDGGLGRIRLYDTMSREVRVVGQRERGELSYYCCGPTVYGPAHIGNFRTYVLQDVLRRVFEAEGVRVRHVRNVTDVDDKTIRCAGERGMSLRAFTREWTERFREDARALNLLEPEVEASAVGGIPEQIRLIEGLVTGGHAYVGGDGSVYFDIRSFAGYGALSHLDGRDLRVGASESGGGQRADEYGKEEASDFALWKAWRPEDGENGWDSPWGRGRPGWHTECAAISLEHLGPGIDVHAGGMDLIFPHHENEIAQAECVSGRRFAGHWFHSAHLMVEGGKMSKSLGNVFTLDDVRGRGHHPMDLRYLLMSGHYRQPLNFTWDSLGAAGKAVERLRRLDERLAGAVGVDGGGDGSGGGGMFEGVYEALRDDLNTPKALGELFRVVNRLESGEWHRPVGGIRVAYRAVLGVLGLEVLPERVGAGAGEVPDGVRELAERRREAKLARDYGTADRLREEIRGAGWMVTDTPEGYELAPAGGGGVG